MMHDDSGESKYDMTGGGTTPRPRTTGRPFLASRTFAGLPGIDHRIVAALKARSITSMSIPQSKYMPAAMAKGDVIVRAATGSGKTLGFLVPAVQRIIDDGTSNGVSVLVLSPTRGLAEQTAVEARSIVSGLGGAIGVQVVIGGKSNKITGRCDIVSATPGRLLDIINGGFASRLREVRVLVLDEADVMLDPGFMKDVMRIVSYLGGPETRQTMLFTATLSQKVLDLAKPPLMRAGVQQINAIGGTARASRSTVTHSVRIIDAGRLLPEAIRVIKAHAKDRKEHRIILFANTVSTVQFYAALLRATGDPVLSAALELHSDMTQPQRERTHATFAQRGGVLVASDVIGRGVDFPDVSLVVQIGIAQNADQVVHRVGRTGRAGRTGEAITFLGSDEASDGVLAEMQAKIPTTTVTRPSGRPSSSHVALVNRAVQDCGGGGKISCRAYISTLGFYSSQRKRLGWNASHVLEAVKRRFEPLGAVSCGISDRLMKKMNL